MTAGSPRRDPIALLRLEAFCSPPPGVEQIELLFLGPGQAIAAIGEHDWENRGFVSIEDDGRMQL